MNCKIKILIGVLLLFVLNRATAQSFKELSDVSVLNKEITAVANNTKTITADFIQEKHLDFLDVVVESKGVFKYKDPQKLRWEYIKPYQYLVLMNEGKFSIVQNGKLKEFDMKESESFQSINNLMIGAIKGNILENKDFVSSVFENNLVYKIRLKPQNKKVSQVIQSIEILINKKTKTVDQLTMFESDTDYTLIKFYNKKINANIEDSNFIYH